MEKEKKRKKIEKAILREEKRLLNEKVFKIKRFRTIQAKQRYINLLSVVSD
jgi:hypothetical protein